jgi:hypothetical protein
MNTVSRTDKEKIMVGLKKVGLLKKCSAPPLHNFPWNQILYGISGDGAFPGI